jgi:hypothetical protein
MRSGRHPDHHPSLRLGLACVVGTLCVLLSFRDGHASGGAFMVDDAGVDDPGACKVESWAAFANNRDFIGVVAPACVVNLGRPVELAAPLGRVRSDGVWSTDLVLKAKTPIIPLDDGKFGIALIGGAGFNLTQGETAAAFVSMPISFQVSDPLRLNLNVGALRNIADDRTLFTWGAGAYLSLTQQVAFVAETFGFGDETGAQVGVRYTPHEKIDFDLIYGRNLTGERADWVTFGVNLRF